MSEPVIIIMGLAFGYLLGSIPFGLLFTRLGGKGDIRDIGSGNIGATNVLRAGSKILALATLLADAAKGGLAVALIWRLGSDTAAYMAGAAAFIGHLFPVWLDFKGGKGVAVFIGAMHKLVKLLRMERPTCLIGKTANTVFLCFRHMLTAHFFKPTGCLLRPFKVEQSGTEHIINIYLAMRYGQYISIGI